ncbi:Tm-1-like ATP-binding domain-containing protein [Dorea sp. D27]|uniref:Tm-1-like ATP-binding domain-containing protein n=1 Tax=Dorea sp. D27 TaxID=658665 RepID=UPI00067374F8|nr:Tm-1-like ATP-binding domain-containing protein [Dorea sp. D27]KMZ53545.1 transcriptional regulator [Dorea sp. D27]
MKTVAVIGALDTKSDEFLYLKTRIEREGIKTLVVDTGILGSPGFSPDISAAAVAREAGENLEQMRREHSRQKSNDTMLKGAALTVRRLHEEGKIDGVITMGGGRGTIVGGEVMRNLPVGFPKVMVSTQATNGYAQHMFEGINDTFVINSLVDISGLNDILKMVMNKAAVTIAGMVKMEQAPLEKTRPRIAMSMLGITTPCVSAVQRRLEQAGFETLVFHSNGLGGTCMEKMIRQGWIDGTADITTAELTPGELGGIGYAGPERLTGGADMGIPQVVVPGAMDIIDFAPPESVPEKYLDRRFIMHVTSLKVVRTSVSENRHMGKLMAGKLNQSKGKAVVAFPLRGLSANDCEGTPFYDREADMALLEALEENLRNDIPIYKYDCHINDEAFADAVAGLVQKVMIS